MRRAWLICLPLILALAGWSAVCAKDEFYVIIVKEKKFSYPYTPYAPLPKSGQTASYGPRDDGVLQKGAAWPNPRFTDNKNGTVTDNLTGLIWTKNANAFGGLNWYEALDAANNLKSGEAGLTDGSKAGDWHLPTIRELLSLVDDGRAAPALPAGHPFTNVLLPLFQYNYWSSTSIPPPAHASLYVGFYTGGLFVEGKSSYLCAWCVRY
ncbi:MAG: Lcl C-terminal domain-containing protein [Desulfobaccales bacterium]